MQIPLLDFIILADNGIHETIKQSKEYEKLSDESIEIYKKLRKTLNDEQITQFDKFAEAQMGLECESSEAYFKAGVKFGVRLLTECLSD